LFELLFSYFKISIKENMMKNNIKFTTFAFVLSTTSIPLLAADFDASYICQDVENAYELSDKELLIAFHSVNYINNFKMMILKKFKKSPQI